MYSKKEYVYYTYYTVKHTTAIRKISELSSIP